MDASVFPAGPWQVHPRRPLTTGAALDSLVLVWSRQQHMTIVFGALARVDGSHWHMASYFDLHPTALAMCMLGRSCSCHMLSIVSALGQAGPALPLYSPCLVYPMQPSTRNQACCMVNGEGTAWIAMTRMRIHALALLASGSCLRQVFKLRKCSMLLCVRSQKKITRFACVLCFCLVGFVSSHPTATTRYCLFTCECDHHCFGGRASRTTDPIFGLDTRSANLQRSRTAVAQRTSERETCAAQHPALQTHLSTCDSSSVFSEV